MTPEQEADIRACLANGGMCYQSNMDLVLEALDAERDKVRQLEAQVAQLEEELASCKKDGAQ
jgi:hypothetical protein